MKNFFLLLGFLLLAVVAETQSQTLSEDQYVILISCDGYRYDYTERFQPPNITRFIEEGVEAASMIPSFPSKTFPNHYTIATGLYPEHHGLVNNSFYNPERDKIYRIRDREVVEDGSWYGGSPLWVNAEQNGMIAASYFFVGSEADVQGVRPSYYHRYDGSIPNKDRVKQVLEWLSLPEEKRPRFITLYFSDMDDAGHRYGPHGDKQLNKALGKLDEALGQLFKGVKKTGLPVNIIMVSDHGMKEVTPDKLINLDPIKQDEKYRIVNNGALAHVYLKEKANKETVTNYINDQAEYLTAYTIEDFPHYHDKSNPCLGDIILLPEYGYYLSDSRRIGMIQSGRFTQGGEHGFHPDFLEMHAIFYANGPAFKKGMKIPSFENIHVYPMICEILGLPLPEKLDGQAEVLRPILK
ncbi:MAG: ectonucleotide pyrophosphatase/phosphodiesterase [Chitinophagales bacterium]|nr:ectonucleotide pyrophosphatase/phosphodiesterase [Chitinophagales bacterium]